MAFGSFFVGLIGASYAHYTGLATPTSYNLMATFWLVMYTMIGGVGSFAGPIVGTAFLRIVPELFRGMTEYTPFLTAGILIIVAYFLRGGIVGLVKTIASRAPEPLRRLLRLDPRNPSSGS